ncbi:MAG: hypothetical protein OEZ34_10030 [Spirochaetia bacterium]|nr:hypothetical protein [Spirochaetia bacterium]
MGNCSRLTEAPLPSGIPEGAKYLSKGLWYYYGPNGELTLHYKNGALLGKGKIQNELKTGIWETYIADTGSTASLGSYQNGWRDGIWKYYDSEGRLYLLITYAPEPKRNFFITKDYGNENGLYERYYPDGSLEERGSFYSGYFNGKITRYHPNGNIAVQGNYLLDLMDGKWIYYFPDGKIEREENYSKGKKNGIFRNFHPDGTLYHETTFKNNIEIGTKVIQRNDRKIFIKKQN